MEKSSLFADKGKKVQEDFQVKVDTHTKALLSVVERQKSLEVSIEGLKEKYELLDSSTIDSLRKLYDEINDIHSQILHVKHDIQTFQEFIRKLKSQISLFTSKDEVLKLEKYIDLWNPIEFVTREEVREIIGEVKKSLIEKLEEYLINSKQPTQ